MDATNEKTDGGEVLVVLLRAEERAERAAEILESVEVLLERAAKTFQGPEREKLRAAAASVRELVGKIDLTVVDAITDVGEASRRRARARGREGRKLGARRGGRGVPRRGG